MQLPAVPGVLAPSLLAIPVAFGINSATALADPDLRDPSLGNPQPFCAMRHRVKTICSCGEHRPLQPSPKLKPQPAGADADGGAGARRPLLHHLLRKRSEPLPGPPFLRVCGVLLHLRRRLDHLAGGGWLHLWLRGGLHQRGRAPPAHGPRHPDLLLGRRHPLRALPRHDRGHRAEKELQEPGSLLAGLSDDEHRRLPAWEPDREIQLRPQPCLSAQPALRPHPNLGWAEALPAAQGPAMPQPREGHGGAKQIPVPAAPGRGAGPAPAPHRCVHLLQGDGGFGLSRRFVLRVHLPARAVPARPRRLPQSADADLHVLRPPLPLPLHLRAGAARLLLAA
ncbi:transmembrane 6 superfamily member 2 isoform X4 [Strix aluco]|uniref:transmembrane 6 superfamily member 2 isoform X4 n=1 Tax=Strix aluco TaxID=111821 RepID=UPI003DA24C06